MNLFPAQVFSKGHLRPIMGSFLKAGIRHLRRKHSVTLPLSTYLPLISILDSV